MWEEDNMAGEVSADWPESPRLVPWIARSCWTRGWHIVLVGSRDKGMVGMGSSPFLLSLSCRSTRLPMPVLPNLSGRVCPTEGSPVSPGIR